MHEQIKINEARYFLNQLSSLAEDRTAFNFTLSAFLAAARSVLQYAFKEATQKPGGQAWYDGQLAGKPIVNFFKDKRDISIHKEPLSPSAKIGVSITETIAVSDTFSVTVRRNDGTIEEDNSPRTSPTPIPSTTESVTTYEYLFSDWSGGEDVITLCQMYLADVEAIVHDGIANSFLTDS